ncbi:hypothetical protein [Evansella clarkii]|uniref:hypothetical protein n=1 Tax=Evansella clarkii TaxID=79879 RepID=UPI0009969F10|nr:hypothetical protein [Evansella clarkii]
MTQNITSYVLRIIETYNDKGEQERRIKLRHVQTEEEYYLSSLEEVPHFIETQLERVKTSAGKN